MSDLTEECKRFLDVCGPYSNYKAFVDMYIPKLIKEIEDLETKIKNQEAEAWHQSH